jgi:methyltransferase
VVTVSLVGVPTVLAGAQASLWGIDSRAWFTGLIVLVALERLVEMIIARRNAKWAFSHGAKEYGAEHYPVMVALHMSLLVAALAEVWLLDPKPIPALTAVSLLLLAGTMSLRYWVIATLGHRWNTRVIVLPESQVVTGGPFRFLRHPNYLAVCTEVAVLPLVHAAFITAIVFSVANALLLRVRIRIEENALRANDDEYELLLPRRTHRRQRTAA